MANQGGARSQFELCAIQFEVSKEIESLPVVILSRRN